jgi:uncharacterized protein YggU (UPF0235/DUF167 family)
MVKVTPRGYGAAFVVKVLSQGSRDELLGVREGELQVRITTPPAGGGANEALITYLAGLLQLPQGHIQIVAGQHGGEKLVALDGISPQEVTDRLRAHLPHP